MVAYLSSAYDHDVVDQTARLLEADPSWIQMVLDYAATFPAEVETAFAAMQRTPDELREFIPNLEVFTVDSTPR